MSIFARRLFCSLLFLTVFPVLARAEIMGAYTAEGLAHKADLIATAMPLSVDTQKGPGDVIYTFTRFKLREVIKGPLSPNDIVTVCDRNLNASDVPRLRETLPNQPSVLIFCAVSQEPSEPVINEKYIMLDLLSSMDKAVFFSNRPVKRVYTGDFKPLTDYSELTDRAREQVKTEAARARSGRYPGPTFLKRIDVPFDSPAFKELYGGSACFLYMPSYEKMDREIVVVPPNDAARLGKAPGFYNAATFTTDQTPFIRTNGELFETLKDLPAESAGLRLPDIPSSKSNESRKYLFETTRYLHRRGVDVCLGSWLDDKLIFGPINHGDE